MAETYSDLAKAMETVREAEKAVAVELAKASEAYLATVRELQARFGGGGNTGVHVTLANAAAQAETTFRESQLYSQ